MNFLSKGVSLRFVGQIITFCIGVYCLYSFLQCLADGKITMGKSGNTILLQDDPGRFWFACVFQLILFFFVYSYFHPAEWFPLMRVRAEAKAKKKEGCHFSLQRQKSSQIPRITKARSNI